MTASDHAVKLASIAALAADEKLAQEIAVIDVSEQLVITDCFVIASGETDRQVSAIVDEVEDKLREAGARPIRKEGVREGRWALLDYGELVVHVQRAEEREFYGLDRLWRGCPLKADRAVSSVYDVMRSPDYSAPPPSRCTPRR